MKNKIFKLTKYYTNLFKNFGIIVTLLDFFEKVFKNINNNAYKYFHLKHHQYVKKYLKKNYRYIIEKYINKENILIDNISQNSNIWVFWWQGIENAPEVVKMCINNMKKHIKNREICILTKDNYQNYVDIPDYIIEKVKKQKITITAFSDILRMQLLYQNGGVWIDSTVLLTDNFDESITQYPFYSIKHGLYSDYHICKGMWSGFFLASGKNNTIVEFFRDMYFDYFKNNDYIITYFLIDCIMAVGYEEIDYIRKIIDEIPQNNENVFYGRENILLEYNSNNLKEFKQNKIYKLSYKEIYDEGKNKTIYKYLVKEEKNVTREK